MKLTWYGHSCFALDNGECRVIFDPYKPGSVPGIEMPEGLTADAVLCSHAHGDHCWNDGVKLSGRAVKADIMRLPTFHDHHGGAKRGGNLISVVEMDGIRAAHFGDIGHSLSDDQIKQLGRLDVIMIPVGGYYTVDAAEALEIVRKFAPAVVVPMHYRGEHFGYGVIGTVEEYAKLCDDVIRIDGSEIELDSIKAPATVIMKY